MIDRSNVTEKLGIQQDLPEMFRKINRSILKFIKNGIIEKG